MKGMTKYDINEKKEDNTKTRKTEQRIRNDDMIRKEQEGGTDVKQTEFRIVHGMK